MKLYVGNLSFKTNADGLRGFFAKFGDVTDAVVVSDRETGRSRGFGFVTFANREDGEKAIAESNGTELDGRGLKVNEAQPRPEGGGGGGGGGRRR